MRRALHRLGAALRGRGATSAASSEPPAHVGLTDVLETLDDALVVTDLALNILQWNAAMERLSGLPRASAVGGNAHRLLPLFDAVGLPHQLCRAIGGEGRFSAAVPGHDGAATTW